MRKIVVQTNRLCIVSQSLEELRVVYDKEIDCGMKQVYAEMMETMRQLPGREEWGTKWTINLLSGQMIGGICFKGTLDFFVFRWHFIPVPGCYVMV